MKIISIIFIIFHISASAKVRQFTFNELCKNATEIFTGRVIQVTVVSESKSEFGNFKSLKILFVTDKVWKGIVSDTIICFAHEGFCANNIFDVGKDYLVYSKNGEIDLGAGRSGLTQTAFIRSDLKKLSIRYLFRRPPIIPTNKRFAAINRILHLISVFKNSIFIPTGLS